MLLQPVSGAGGVAGWVFRQELTGVFDGVNRVFALPQTAFFNLPSLPVLLYHCSRPLRFSEYEVFESVVGGGYDRVKLLYFAPNRTSVLFADFIPA